MPSNIDIEKLLQLLESCGAVRLNRPMGEWYSMYCPFHNRGQEKKPSAGMTVRDSYANHQLRPKGVFHCFSCGQVHELKDFVQAIFKLYPIPHEIRKTIQDMVEISEEGGVKPLLSESTIRTMEAKYAVNRLRSKMSKQKMEYVSEEELQSYRYTVPYMYERGLTDELIERYDIGVDLKFIPPGRSKPVPCITFPVRDRKGGTLLIARRSIEGKQFYLPSGIEKPIYGIWELPKDCKSVVICESCFNALTSVKYGRPAVALLGTGTPSQMETLKRLGVREFIIGLDPDEAGIRGSRRIHKALKGSAFIWDFEGIPEGKDINDLTYDEFANLNIV